MDKNLCTEDISIDKTPNSYICKLCNNEYKSRMSLMNHIIRTHHYTGKQYFDEFFKCENDGFCENCGKPTKFLNIDDGYAKCCCIKCAMPGRAKRNLDKYGYTDNFHNPEILKKAHSKEANQKREQTMLDRYGCKSYLETDTVKQQAKEFYRKKYNKDYYAQTDEYKKKVKKTSQEKYNVDYVLQSNEIKEKSKQSKLAKYGDQNYNNRPKAEQTTLKKFGVRNVLTLPEVQEKAQRNSHTPEAIAKIHINRNYREIAIATAKTKKSNGNKSTNELEFESLCKLNNVKYIEEYSDERYPFPCDFYLPDLDCFVELHCSWVHNDHIYNEKEDKLLLAKWQEKAKYSNYYKSAIKTWTVKDVNKLNTAKQNKLNYIILWNTNDIQLWFAMNCPKCIKYETYTWITCRIISNKLEFSNKLTDGSAAVTKIAKVAQFDEFYKRELAIWNNADLKFQIELYLNRVKYISKLPDKLTDLEILRGLNISGKIKSYSVFNNSGLKYFIKKYNIQSLYDPCAGWGERLLTCASNNVKYFGIDINQTTVNNYKKLIDVYHLTDQQVICGDSSKIVNYEDYDATFTCPPYWNTEIYSDKGAENLSYDEFLSWWKQVIKNSNTEYFAYQINNKYAEDMNKCFENYKLINTYTLRQQTSHFHKSNGQNLKSEYETVYIFQKC